MPESRCLCTPYFSLRIHKEKISGTTHPVWHCDYAVPQAVLVVLKQSRSDVPGHVWGQQQDLASIKSSPLRRIFHPTRNRGTKREGTWARSPTHSEDSGKSLGHQEPVSSSVTGGQITGIAVTIPGNVLARAWCRAHKRELSRRLVISSQRFALR